MRSDSLPTNPMNMKLLASFDPGKEPLRVRRQFRSSHKGMGVIGMRARLRKIIKVQFAPMEPVDVRGAPGLIIRTVKAKFEI